MKNKFLWILAAAAVGLLALLKISGGGGGNDETYQAAKTFTGSKVESALVSLNTEPVDLGEIKIGSGLVETEFKFKNTGAESITLVYGETSCMCTEAVVKRANGEMSPRIKMPGHGGNTGPLNLTLEPGEEAVLLAIFDPMAHGPDALGPIDREIVLKTNSKTTPELRFSFLGNVIK
ncbi:MAG: DUF1573 domain-containing protein [Patescibacteria group bacterium]